MPGNLRCFFVRNSYVGAVLKQGQSLPKSVTLVTRYKSMPEMRERAVMLMAGQHVVLKRKTSGPIGTQEHHRRRLGGRATNASLRAARAPARCWRHGSALIVSNRRPSPRGICCQLEESLAALAVRASAPGPEVPRRNAVPALERLAEVGRAVESQRRRHLLDLHLIVGQ